MYALLDMPKPSNTGGTPMLSNSSSDSNSDTSAIYYQWSCGRSCAVVDDYLIVEYCGIVCKKVSQKERMAEFQLNNLHMVESCSN